MIGQRHILLAAAAFASLAAAIPAQAIAFTAHTESTEAVLMLPSATSTTSKNFIYTDSSPTTTAKNLSPEAPHIESTQAELVAPTPQPTPQTTPQAQAETMAALTTNSPDQNNGYTSPPATSPATVYIAHIEASVPTVAVPTPAYQDNPAASSLSPQVIVWTSNNVVYSQTAAPATTPIPVLYASASGALGIAAGSSAIVVEGKTYSLAAGGSALWIDGSSMSLSMPMTSNRAAHMTTSAAVNSGKATGSLKPVATSSITSSVTSVKTSTVATHAVTSSAAPVATGAAIKQDGSYMGVSFAIAAGLAGLMAL